MSDSSKQRGDAPPDQHAARLAQRGGGSAGVIDVGWAQQRYASTTDWVVQRYALLGAMSARYGTVDTQASGASAALPIASGRFARRGFDVPPDEPPGGEPPPGPTGGRAPTPAGGARASETPAPSTNTGGATGALDLGNVTAAGASVKRSVAPEGGVTRGVLNAVNTQSAPLVQRKPATTARAEAAGGPTVGSPLAASEQTVGGESQHTSALELQRAPALESRNTSTIESQSTSSSETQGTPSIESPAQPHAALDSTPASDAGGESPSVAATSPERSPVQTPVVAEPLVLREAAPTISRVARKASESLAQETTAALETENSSTLARQTSEPSAARVETAGGLPLSPASQAVSADGARGDEDVRSAQDAPGTEGVPAVGAVRGQEQAQGAEGGANFALPLAVMKTASERPRQTIQRSPEAGAPASYAGESSPTSSAGEASSPRRAGDATLLSHEDKTSVTEASPKMEWAGPPPEGTLQRAGQNGAEQSGAGQASAGRAAGQADTPAGASSAQRPASAPEILQRKSNLSGARMVWRKAAGGREVADGRAPFAGHSAAPRVPSTQAVAGSIMPYRTEATLYRAEDSASHEASNGHDGGGAGVASAPSNGGGISLEQITEHVSRILLRRVSVERERRGVGKWL